MVLPEQEMNGGAVPEAGTAGTVAAGTAAADAEALIEAVVQRDRQRDPAAEADYDAIHQRALLAAEAASGVKGEDVKVLDMRDLVTYTDYLVLCTGRNVRLIKRIAEEVAFKLKQEYELLPAGTEGMGGGEWILLDYYDFMVHVFTPEARDFYRLDVLWKRAPVETVE